MRHRDRQDRVGHLRFSVDLEGCLLSKVPSSAVGEVDTDIVSSMELGLLSAHSCKWRA